jgi:hypothetical protein
MKKEKEVFVTPQGSLGLLALGHIGIEKWRAAVRKAEEEMEKKKTSDGKKTHK